MENNTQLDFATLALKGKRYQEAENIYMQLATNENSSEAWLGIGICKLYQLTEGKTMDEVIFCFNKSSSINPESKLDIDRELMIHTMLVFNTYGQIIEAAGTKYHLAKKTAKTGAILAGISFIAGMNSSKAFSTVASLAGTGVGVGVAVDSLNKMDDYKALIKIILDKYNDVYTKVIGFIDNQHPDLVSFCNSINNIAENAKREIAVIEGRKDKSIMTNEDAKRLSFLVANTNEFNPFNTQNRTNILEMKNIMDKYDFSVLERGKLKQDLKGSPLH